MADKFTPVDEEDQITSGQVNSLFSVLEAEVNDLPLTSIQSNSLHDVHLPSLVLEAQTISYAGTPNHTYTNRYPGWGSDTLVSSAGASGWSAINSGGEVAFIAGSGTNLQATFSTGYPLTGSTAGILVFFNVYLHDLVLASGVDHDVYALFKIQVWNGSAWRSIARTERFTRAETSFGPGTHATVTGGAFQAPVKDIAIRTFISDADLASSGDSISRVRVLAAVATTSTTVITLTLKQAHLSAMILHASLQESL